ncbi:hypothetical protein GCM10022254_30780 [Actinomadura meridiana]|uniref:Uncharacterized protein n=1 Tax=Actinomadura meridiana TaxID=559626 RepID=A0ABP8C1G4_9ACTN
MTTIKHEAIPIVVKLPKPFRNGWNRIKGVTVEGAIISIDPVAYFFRYENPTWLLCDWDGVRSNLLDAQETTETVVEQMTLDYIKEHGCRTSDPAKVLTTAYAVYCHTFREEYLEDPSLAEMGVTSRDLRALTEMGTMMALNRVELDGSIGNVGPAWMFGEAAKVVFDLDSHEAEKLDHLYHGSWFNEPRRTEQIKAHAALGGRLVHGCQSGQEQHMAGGCVAPYGADIQRFRRELRAFRREWIERVRSCGR